MTSVERPDRANSTAAETPFGPEPTMMASYFAVTDPCISWIGLLQCRCRPEPQSATSAGVNVAAFYVTGRCMAWRQGNAGPRTATRPDARAGLRHGRCLDLLQAKSGNRRARIDDSERQHCASEVMTKRQGKRRSTR